LLIENHEFDLIGLKEPLKEFESKPTESVSIGNNNFRDCSALAQSQKVQETFPFKVDSRTNISNDFMIWKE
jgi:hypothetical protein